MNNEPVPAAGGKRRPSSKTAVVAGAGILVAAGLALIVGGLWWVDGDVRAVAAFLFGSGLIALGCFFPRVRGNIIIGKEGVTIPVDALVEEVTASALELPEIHQMSALQAVEVVDRALRDLAGRSDLKWDPTLQTMTIGPARSGFGSRDVVREAVSHAAEAVLVGTGGTLTASGTVESQKIPEEKRDPRDPPSAE